MHPKYDSGMVAFTGPNVDLMRYALDELTTDPEDRDAAAFIQRVETYLAQSDWPGWMANERETYLAALHASLQRGRVQSTAVAAPTAQAASEDLGPLSEEDRAAYRALEQQLREGKWNEAFTAVRALADRYPTFLPVRQKACGLGMQFGVGLVHIKPYCERMNGLLQAR